MNKEHILSEIKRTTQENAGQPLGIDRFKKETGICKEDWYGKFWGKWSDALKEAGYKPNRFSIPAYDEKWLINQLILYIRELKRFPTRPDLKLKHYNDKNFPSYITFYKRLGKKAELIQKVKAFCKDKKDLIDVLEICRSTNAPKISESFEPNIKQSDVQYGFVYLMKLGKNYKIGRSNFVEKRKYELGIKLPEELKLIHKIKTDDPNGIESYWHKRFEGKRIKGEWFQLSHSDISAFKRRKFM